ncbi:unnamed protein product [Laminaria digitata]
MPRSFCPSWSLMGEPADFAAVGVSGVGGAGGSCWWEIQLARYPCCQRLAENWMLAPIREGGMVGNTACTVPLLSKAYRKLVKDVSMTCPGRVKDVPNSCQRRRQRLFATRPRKLSTAVDAGSAQKSIYSATPPPFSAIAWDLTACRLARLTVVWLVVGWRSRLAVRDSSTGGFFF